ncbi:MAG: ABC transporter permease, partial [Bacteroidetes bacterium]|nr:ABC transporter permease [Fibrella sp.]
MKGSPRPPRWADRLLTWFCAPHLLEEVQGDLHERFQRDVQQYGPEKARQRYGQNMLGFMVPRQGQQSAGLPPSPYSASNFSTMLQRFFLISLRNLWRNRRISAINVAGLAVGLAGGITLFLLVTYLFSFDRYHARANRSYWVVTDEHHEQVNPTDATPRPLGEVLRRDFPFVESAVRLDNIFRRIISVPDGKGRFLKKFEESRNLCFTEPQFFEIFDTEWLAGDRKTALSTPNTVVLSERYAQKYFGDMNPMGRVVRFDNKVDLTVTGLIKNLPSNTKLRYDALISYATVPGWLGQSGQREMQSWGGISSMCFLTLREGVPLHQLLGAFPVIEEKYLNAEEARAFEFHAIPLGELDHDPQHGGRTPRPLLYALIIVGVALVLAACINFINITTAQVLKRAKEVGVRKTVGSSRRQLIGQFMTETSLIVVGSALVALVLMQLGLPVLNTALAVIGADLSLFNLFQPNALSWFVGLLVGVILLAGLYPSLVLARLNPVAALRGRLTIKQVGSVNVRRGLVVLQFFITQLFIIGVAVMMSQLRYMNQADLGFAKDAILTIPVPNANPIQQQTLRERLGAVPGVEQIALGSEPPAANRRNGGLLSVDLNPEIKKLEARIKVGDMNYVPVFGLKILAGRNFRSNDTAQSEALVNETLVKKLGLPRPTALLGKKLNIWGVDKTIVGVVRDFHTDGLQATIQPTAILTNYHDIHIASLKINSVDLPNILKAVESVWNAQFPEAVYSALFTDDLLAEFYITERILLGLAQVFSVLAILIGCLGLYGLVMFMAESRTKEIGVRKVLGANPGQLLWLFGREFGGLLLIGFALAAPLGWLLMNGWLRGYAYRIDVGWWVFALTLALVIIVTTLTVSYESL